VAYGLLALPVHLLVVIYSLGRGDLLGGLGPFRDAWRREDLQAAAHVAKRDLNICADSGEELLDRVQGHLLWEAYQSFFAVIFWYFVLGPVAALAYRLLALAEEHGTNPALVERAAQLRHAFDWVPVRLLAASFALVGNFVAVGRVMLHELLNWNISAAQLINKVGLAAGEIPPAAVGPEGITTLDSLWELLLRAAVLWYAGFALWTVLIH
jgi:AmpE protein